MMELRHIGTLKGSHQDGKYICAKFRGTLPSINDPESFTMESQVNRRITNSLFL